MSVFDLSSGFSFDRPLFDRYSVIYRLKILCFCSCTNMCGKRFNDCWLFYLEIGTWGFSDIAYENKFREDFLLMPYKSQIYSEPVRLKHPILEIPVKVKWNFAKKELLRVFELLGQGFTCYVTVIIINNMLILYCIWEEKYFFCKPCFYLF